MSQEITTWYYAAGDEQYGPVETEELQKLRESGVIQASTLVWNEGNGGLATSGRGPGAAGRARSSPTRA